MNPKEIKVGETYNVRVTVTAKSKINTIGAATVTESGKEIMENIFYERELAAFSPINPYPPLNLPTTTEIPETAPKYDPCRPFKAGDIVKPCSVKGRWWDFTWKERHEHIVVTEDEDKDGVMGIKEGDSIYPRLAPAVFFQLVTPVEEMRPYSVETCQYGYTVNKGEDILATYNDEKHPHAKAAAEAERDRLNAEHRKEMEK